MHRHDIELRGGGIALGHRVGDQLGPAGNLGEGGGERARIAADLRPGLVGAIFAGAADRHLHDHRGKGGDDHRQQGRDHVAMAIFIVTAATEEEAEIGQHRNGAGNSRHHRHDQGVAILHMAQFMRHHACHLVAGQHVQQAGGRRHGSIFRIAASGKGVGRILVDHIDARHRQAGALAQRLDQAVKFGRALGIHLARIVHGQHDLVGIPEGEQVHPRRHQQGDHRAAAATQRIAQCHEQRRQRRQQHHRAKTTHLHIAPLRPR